MAFPFRSESFQAPSGQSLERVLRERYSGASWTEVRRLVTTGKVQVDGRVIDQPRFSVAAGASVSLHMTTPRPRSGLLAGGHQRPELLHVDPHVVVVCKPEGISSVAHDAEPTSLQQQLQAWLSEKERRKVPPLRVVHRLDKVTSGVMMFARTDAAQKELKDQFRAHTTGRYYVAIAHGAVHDATLHFRLIRNRGDGLRGVTFEPTAGTHSVTHVTLERQCGPCSVIRCQLETGRTHQIRIHLAQIGHPIVGEPLYIKGYRGKVIPCSRTLLHAAFLSFRHPVHRKTMRFEQPVPAAFKEFEQRMSGAGVAQ